MLARNIFWFKDTDRNISICSAILFEFVVQMNCTFTELCQLKQGGPVIMRHRLLNNKILSGVSLSTYC